MVKDEQLQQLIARCRRLASEMSDESTREALERLALEYEAQLNHRPGPFILGPDSPRE